MSSWISGYIEAQNAALDSIPIAEVEQLVRLLRKALHEDRQVFVFGNGGSASNASHFVMELGKCASASIGKNFRCLSLNDNVSWITALGNDYSFEDIFVCQLQNYARPGDLAMALSTSGNSPNVVKALRWAAKNGLTTIAMVGAKRGALAETADHVLVIDSVHAGRVEDAQMTVCHLLCFAFTENPECGK